MKNLLICSCLKDDFSALVSVYLLKNKLSEVEAGVAAKAKELDADVIYLLPEGEKVDGMDAEVKFGTYNPTLGNPYAVAQFLEGNLPRPMIQDEFVAVYDNKTVNVITPEEAYHNSTGTSTRFVGVTTANGNTEIKEVEIGTKASEFVDITDAKAVLIGGLKGTFVKPEALSDYELSDVDTDKSFTVINNTTCIVDYVVKLTEKIWQASCGKCVLCREGSLQFKTIASEMVSGKAKMTDLDMIKEVASLIEVGAYCPYGKNMTKPLVSAIELFPLEFEAHIKKKECALGVCYKKEAVYVILPDKCVGCGDCVDECDEDAIEGKAKFIHMIDQDMCEQCGKCVDACEEEAIVKWEDAKLPKLPKKLTKVGKF